MRVASITLICLTSAFLLLYPFVLLANVMSYAGYANSATTSLGLSIAMSGFLWSSTLYPLPYLAALIVSIIYLKRKNDKKALQWQIGLLAYIGIIIGFMIAWMIFE